jgi:hypothetical protein
MAYLPHDPKMCDMSILPYGPNLVAYATIVDATIFAQEAQVHDLAGRLAKNLSGFQKSAQWAWAQWPVTVVGYELIDCKMPGCCNFVLRQFFETFSLIHETFALFPRSASIQFAN